MFPRTDIKSGWGRHGTEGGRLASFYKRYYQPLLRFARFKFKIGDEQAEELTSRYLARELERDLKSNQAVFRLYDPEKGRFRSLLATSFWRFCRDQLALDRTYESLENYDEAAEDYEFCRLVARDFFNHLRAKIEKRLESPSERAVLALKWPEQTDREPMSNAEIERQLGLSRSKVRTLIARIADQFIFIFNQEIHKAGLGDEAARDLLGDCCRILDHEQQQPK